MKKRLLLLLVVSLIFMSGCATRISEVEKIPEEIVKVTEEPRQESTYPPQEISTPNENEFLSIQEECAKKPLIPSGKYQGLLTDVHVHTMMRDNPFDFALKLLEEMNKRGVDRIIIQPNHDPSGMVQNSEVLDRTWGDIAAVCPRIIPLIYGFNPDNPEAWKYVEELLNTGNYGGVGEIEFQHGNLPIKHDPESESMLKIYQILNERRLALHFQADIRRDPSLEEKMFMIIQRYPDINFIWFGCPSTQKFLNLPNLYCNIFLHSQSYPLSDSVQKSMVGSDASPEGFWNPSYGLLPYQSFGEAMKQAREELGELPANEREKLAHGNFDKIWKK